LHKALSFLGVGLVAATACIATVRPVGAQPIVDTVRGHPVSILFSLPADAIPQLNSASSNGALEVIARVAGGGDLAVGRLAVISNQIDPSSGLIRLKAAFDNTNEALHPGRTADVRILGYSAIGEIIP
jgi:multidrug efflux pump subunit AcrA (membrane-fusion protein)